jgi:membrane protein DedA with SNARE-associated domain
VVIYYIGKFAGDVVVRSFLRKYGRWVGTSEEDYNRALVFFDRHRGAVVLFGRVIPLVRTIISMPVGAALLPLRTAAPRACDTADGGLISNGR